MEKQTIEKLNNAKIGEVIETKKWIFTIVQCNVCKGCFLYEKPEPCINFRCTNNTSVDGKRRIFTRVRNPNYNKQAVTK